METQYCPICKVEVTANPRYPKYVCQACHAKATDENGRKLAFYNADFSGGFIAVYADNRESYSTNLCYINGIKCWADEARFGGIVIEPV